MYISKETLNSQWGICTCLYSPYGEGITNFTKAFTTTTGEPKSLKDRLKHFCAGLSLIIPLINGIALYILSGLTSSIQKQKMEQELENLKKNDSKTPKDLIKAFGYEGVICLIDNSESRVTFSQGFSVSPRKIITASNALGNDDKHTDEQFDHNMSKFLIFTDKLYTLNQGNNEVNMAVELAKSVGATYGGGDASSIHLHKPLLEKHVSKEFADRCLVIT